jgi:hypothetical protein
VRLVLWDERKQRLISFREMHILTPVMHGPMVAASNQAQR